MNSTLALTLICCIGWFGLTLLYFIKYLRENTDYEITTMSLLMHFFGDLKNIFRFYHSFYKAHQVNKFGRGFTLFLILSNVISYASFGALFIILFIVNSDFW